MDLVTSPSAVSPLSTATTVLNSESIEVLGAVAEPRSENSSFIVVASSASSTPASEFSDAADHQLPRVKVDDEYEEENDDDYPEEEDDENTMSESLAVTVMEPRGTSGNDDTKIVTIPPSRQSLHLSLSNTSSSAGNLSKSAAAAAISASLSDMDNSSTGSDQTLINLPDNSIAVGHKTNASSIALSLESYELQTEFSDSTQSFEEVPRDSNGSQAPATNTSSGDEIETTTSSDIEIISNPNGDGSSTASRLSPHKDSGVVVVTGSGGGVFKGNRGHSR